MTQSRKDTAYRKSRKFGDVYGGRVRARLPDGIFRRAHSLKRPGPHDDLPILIEDNPSRKFFFPLSGPEILQALEALPKNAQAGITHVVPDTLEVFEEQVAEVDFAIVLISAAGPARQSPWGRFEMGYLMARLGGESVYELHVEPSIFDFAGRTGFSETMDEAGEWRRRLLDQLDAAGLTEDLKLKYDRITRR